MVIKDSLGPKTCQFIMRPTKINILMVFVLASLMIENVDARIHLNIFPLIQGTKWTKWVKRRKCIKFLSW